MSAVNADFYDADGRIMPQDYHGRTRRERHEELVAYGIRGGIAQASAPMRSAAAKAGCMPISCGKWAAPSG